MLDRSQHGRTLLAERRWDEALTHYRDDAEAGDGAAQIEYARILLHGVAGPADPAQAVDWLNCAEAAGHAEAGYYLASIALGGTLLERDARINERILLAARAGMAPALRAAALNLGRRADPRDQALCVTLLERAANAGDAVAVPLLAERLHRGEGTPVRPADARRWWRALANCGLSRLPWLKPWTLPTPPVKRDDDGPALLSFGDALCPPPWTLLSGRPRVMRLPRLLSTDECRMLIALAQMQAATDQTDGAEVRFDPSLDDFSLRWLQLLMARAARTDLSRTDTLVVQRQEAGAPARELIGGAQPSERQRALCVVLAPALAGGALDSSGVASPISLAPGDAMLFDAAPDDGPSCPDAQLRILPVREGTLWLATLWLRHRACREF